jgi:hypothetical protein
MGKVTELFIRRLCRKVKKAFKRACAEREISMQVVVLAGRKDTGCGEVPPQAG